ncbi:hypothetical protein [Bradyrhizobium sp. CCBAU 21360]|uniref:hypothetical protein n=1 Tax=Bradyrhizobium sp. CCBAU 21360 TaxID=1325081 RepID=UPI002306410B|nr:hypothetical protein [Bradyrhizobium sp. CCBAU 21360]
MDVYAKLRSAYSKHVLAISAGYTRRRIGSSPCELGHPIAVKELVAPATNPK